MGLKDLKSNLDLLGGFGNEGGTLGEMENFNPVKFQRSVDEASQAHIDSLEAVPGGTQNSPHQDLNIDVTTETPPAFQRPKDLASQVHESSLSLVPGGSQNSPFQDLDGEQGPQFQKATDVASQAHVSSLAVVPGGSQSSPFQDRNNGAVPSQYVNNMPN